ncbi:MAG: AsmA family protein, partial [Bacteroidota bacterium]
MAMRKIVKVSLIVLLTLVGLFVTSVGLALWFVFTPERISPVINTQARAMMASEVDVELGRVELTFFSTFPRLGLKVDQIMLVNPQERAPSDTLLDIESMQGIIDTWAFWRRNEVILSGVTMTNGTINIFTDSLGRTNYDVLQPDTLPRPETDTAFSLHFVEMGQVEFNNVNMTYIDESSQIHTGFRNLNAMIKGKMVADTIEVDVDFDVASLSFSMGGEPYLDNASLEATLPATVFSSLLKVDLHKAQAIINGMPVNINGSFMYNESDGDIFTDMQYSFYRLDVKNLLALVPPSFQSYFDGMVMDGMLSSAGKVTGIYNDSLMPLLDVRFQLEEGTFNYTEIPLPLYDMNGDLHLFTDLADDEKSFAQIHQFSARTSNSSFETEGLVTRLFSDIHCDLTSQANILLNELAPFVPDTIPLTMSGRVSGEMGSQFTLTDLQEMNLEKIKINSDLVGQNLDILYDSIWMKTDRAQLALALPNPRATSPQTRFTLADISTGVFQ